MNSELLSALAADAAVRQRAEEEKKRAEVEAKEQAKRMQQIEELEAAIDEGEYRPLLVALNAKLRENPICYEFDLPSIAGREFKGRIEPCGRSIEVRLPNFFTALATFTSAQFNRATIQSASSHCGSADKAAMKIQAWIEFAEDLIGRLAVNDRLDDARAEAKAQEEAERAILAAEAEDIMMLAGQHHVEIGNQVSDGVAELMQECLPSPIHVYLWTWCTSARTSDGEQAEYDACYSLQTELDTGWLRTLDGREIKLDMDAHKPIVEKITWQKISQIPSQFTDLIRVSVQNARETYLRIGERVVGRWVYSTQAEGFTRVLVPSAVLRTAFNLPDPTDSKICVTRPEVIYDWFKYEIDDN